jgi:hypothetical protein
MRRLKKHIPGYAKGAGGAFAATRPRLHTATGRAEALATRFSAYDDPEPFTAIVDLVKQLVALRS